MLKIPIIIPERIIMGARSLAIDEKFGSVRGVQNIQLVIAPPLIAIKVSTITLIIWVLFSEEY